MRVAMIQMDMQLGKPEANFEKAEKLVRMAAGLIPEVITLLEPWNTGFFPRENLKDASDVDLEQTKKLFSRLAKEYRVNIIAGSVANCRDEKIYNTAAVFNRDGEVVMEYDKVHLFSPFGEHVYFKNKKGYDGLKEMNLMNKIIQSKLKNKKIIFIALIFLINIIRSI